MRLTRRFDKFGNRISKDFMIQRYDSRGGQIDDDYTQFVEEEIIVDKQSFEDLPDKMSVDLLNQLIKLEELFSNYNRQK